MGDRSIVIQPTIRFDYLYLIYKKVLFVDHLVQLDLFDNYGNEIPRLLWFKKGYRLM